MKGQITFLFFIFTCLSVEAQTRIDSLVREFTTKTMSEVGLTEDDCKQDSFIRFFTKNSILNDEFNDPEYYCYRENTMYEVFVVQQCGVTGFVIHLLKPKGDYSSTRFEIIMGSKRLVAFKAIGTQSCTSGPCNEQVVQVFNYDRRKAKTEIWVKTISYTPPYRVNDFVITCYEIDDSEPAQILSESRFATRVRALFSGKGLKEF